MKVPQAVMKHVDIEGVRTSGGLTVMLGMAIFMAVGTMFVWGIPLRMLWEQLQDEKESARRRGTEDSR